MNTQHRSVLSTFRAVLTFPLVRVPLLGGVLFVGMGISNGFMQTYGGSPPVALALVLLVVALALLERLVRADLAASPESPSAQNARNLNKEKHRA